jgi:hypothetical protein
MGREEEANLDTNPRASLPDYTKLLEAAQAAEAKAESSSTEALNDEREAPHPEASSDRAEVPYGGNERATPEQAKAFKNELDTAVNQLLVEATGVTDLTVDEENFLTSYEIIRTRLTQAAERFHYGDPAIAQRIQELNGSLSPSRVLRDYTERDHRAVQTKLGDVETTAQAAVAAIDDTVELPAWKAGNAADNAILPFTRLSKDVESLNRQFHDRTGSTLTELSYFASQLRDEAVRTDSPDVMNFYVETMKLVDQLGNDAQSALASGGVRTESMKHVLEAGVMRSRSALTQLRPAA